MLKHESYTRNGDVYYMKGAKFSEIEEHTAIKLSKEDYYIVFPSKGQIKQIKKIENDNSLFENDVYLYDKKTYH